MNTRMLTVRFLFLFLFFYLFVWLAPRRLPRLQLCQIVAEAVPLLTARTEAEHAEEVRCGSVSPGRPKRR